MKKRLTSFLLVLALSFSLSLPAFAVDDNNYYSLPPVGGSEPSTSNLYPVNPSEFDNSDSQTLTNIFRFIQYLTLSPASWQRDSVIGFLDRILDAIPSNLSTNFQFIGSGRGTNTILDEIAKWSMFSYNYLSSDNIAGNLGNIQRNTSVSADRLLSLVQAVSGIDGFATEATLSSISGKVASENTLVSFFNKFGLMFGTDSYISTSESSQYLYRIGFDGEHILYSSFGTVLWVLLHGIGYYGKNYFGEDTLYTRVSKLQDTLASDDDRQLAQNYKENREQAEKDFLSGQSGKTSLGKGDFSNASQVGGALNDTFNMGGAAKVSDFLSGFGSAGSESQSWFSQTTANNLNSVEAGDGTQGVSTFSDDGETMLDVDPDPYNMASIFERYDWLEGVYVDD